MAPLRLAAPAVALLALGGCGGKTVDVGSVEKQLSENLAHGAYTARPKLDCPSGKKAEKGTRFTCDGVVQGQRFQVEVTMTAPDKFTFRIRQ